MNAALHNEQEHFLSSVTDYWWNGTTVKDLGPYILNLVPGPENYDSWEYEDGPSFPALDYELTAAEAAGDYLINSEVLLPVGNSHELSQVLWRKHDHERKPAGVVHHQSALDSRVYEVQFLDSRTKELTANAITEVLCAKCDPDGNEYVLLDAIMDYRKDPDVAISCADQVKIIDGKKYFYMYVCGWELCCKWKNSSTSWQNLSNLKESYPLQVAEFVFAVQIC